MDGTILIDYPAIRDYLSLQAAGPRPYSRAAFSSAKMCYASFCLPSPSLGTEQKEARTQGLIRNFSSNTPNWQFEQFNQNKFWNYLIA